MIWAYVVHWSFDDMHALIKLLGEKEKLCSNSDPGHFWPSSPLSFSFFSFYPLLQVRPEFVHRFYKVESLKNALLTYLPKVIVYTHTQSHPHLLHCTALYQTLFITAWPTMLCMYCYCYQILSSWRILSGHTVHEGYISMIRHIQLYTVMFGYLLL